jgi:hypothetical protein
MATNNKRLAVAELDFDNIKSNLKNYLKGQTEFSDYDFEGSAMSTLIDLLAYNTHYNAIYNSLAVNEMFLDSASKRSSVVSLSKMLGYMPRSARCAEAVVDITIVSPTSNPDVATLPSGQPFLTSVDNVSYIFYNEDAVSVSKNADGKYVFQNVKLREGTPLQFKYTVQDGQRYIIPNANIDSSTLSVTVQDYASSDMFDVYSLNTDLTQVTDQTKVYFLKEIDNGLYEVNFGDGNLGFALSNGNVVTFKYYVSSLETPNGAKTFTYNGTSILGSNLSVVTTTAAFGGASPESLASIKFTAPKLYGAQNRAVTPDDYKAIIYSQFPQAQTIQVWGGEVNNPPVYGKTYICIKPKDAVKLTNQQKDYIVNNILASKNVVSITPEIVDPEYFNVEVQTFVHYNPRNTSIPPSQIETLVREAILNYSATDLQKFEGVLRFSKLSKIIDQAEFSISNNITRILVHHPHSPVYGVSKQYVLNLINPIDNDSKEAVFYTTGFYVPAGYDLNGNTVTSPIHYMEDDGKGNVRLYYLDNNFNKVIVNDKIGSIDYSIGQVIVRNLIITALVGPVFDWIVRPASYDVTSALNQIVQIDPSTLQVTAIADNTNNGDTQAGYNYTFNSIRS